MRPNYWKRTALKVCVWRCSMLALQTTSIRCTWNAEKLVQHTVDQCISRCTVFKWLTNDHSSHILNVSAAGYVCVVWSASQRCNIYLIAKAPTLIDSLTHQIKTKEWHTLGTLGIHTANLILNQWCVHCTVNVILVGVFASFLSFPHSLSLFLLLGPHYCIMHLNVVRVRRVCLFYLRG